MKDIRQKKNEIKADASQVLKKPNEVRDIQKMLG